MEKSRKYDDKNLPVGNIAKQIWISKIAILFKGFSNGSNKSATNSKRRARVQYTTVTWLKHMSHVSDAWHHLLPIVNLNHFSLWFGCVLECLKQTNKALNMGFANYQLAAAFRRRNTSALQGVLEPTEVVPCPYLKTHTHSRIIQPRPRLNVEK